MKIVVDASVAVKWIIADHPAEYDTGRAVVLLRNIQAERVSALLPPHCNIEVLSVITRSAPDRVQIAIELFERLPVQIVSSGTVLRRACELASQLNQHVFDTLYHAVALDQGATLVTADDQYYFAARRMGSIELLTAFDVGGTVEP